MKLAKHYETENSSIIAQIEKCVWIRTHIEIVCLKALRSSQLTGRLSYSAHSSSLFHHELERTLDSSVPCILSNETTRTAKTRSEQSYTPDPYRT